MLTHRPGHSDGGTWHQGTWHGHSVRTWQVVAVNVAPSWPPTACPAVAPAHWREARLDLHFCVRRTSTLRGRGRGRRVSTPAMPSAALPCGLLGSSIPKSVTGPTPLPGLMEGLAPGREVAIAGAAPGLPSPIPAPGGVGPHTGCPCQTPGPGLRSWLVTGGLCSAAPGPGLPAGREGCWVPWVPCTGFRRTCRGRHQPHSGGGQPGRPRQGGHGLSLHCGHCVGQKLGQLPRLAEPALPSPPGGAGRCGSPRTRPEGGSGQEEAPQWQGDPEPVPGSRGG